MTRDPAGIEVTSVTVGPFQENTFFLKRLDREDVVIIDPGDEPDRLIDLVEDRGWRPAAIVNTHAHLDHVGAVEPFKRHFGIEFWLHHDDLPLLRGAPEHARLFGVRPPVVPEVEHDLAGLTTLEVAGIRFELRHTPGHSPGSVSLVLPGRVVSGDVLFEGSIGRTDLPGGSLPVLMQSIERCLLSLPDETIVHCGHGPDTTIGRERQTNPFILQELS
jgi:glyoxylase-like metal-dependent hydrolase (beta-lactamase superfamily II)